MAKGLAEKLPLHFTKLGITTGPALKHLKSFHHAIHQNLNFLAAGFNFAFRKPLPS